MKRFNKFIALGLAGAMVIGSSMTAFAGENDPLTPAEGGTGVTGTGTGANVASSLEVYSLSLPTQATIDKLFDFDVDPQGLAVATAGARYGAGITIGDNTGVLFPNYSEDGSKIVGVSDTSDSLIITNKSSKGVKLTIESKVASGGDYAGGYSKTSDFSGTGDNTKGLYFGLIQSGDLEKSVDTTGVTETNAVKSSADQYETKAEESGVIGSADKKYTYALKSDAKDFATYEFKMTGQLNDEMAETTWYTVQDHGVTGKTFGNLEVKFVPDLISSKTTYDKHGVAIIRPSDGVMVVGKAEENGHPAGDLGDTKVAAVIINEKGSGVAPTVDNASGFSIITWDQILTTFGYTGDDYKIGTDNATELLNKLQTVTFTFGGNKYYADVIVAEF